MILLVAYLSLKESDVISNRLNENLIEHNVLTIKTAFSYKIIIYYEKDIPEASKIVNECRLVFAKENLSTKLLCPRCHQKNILVMKKSFFDKIYSLGTTKMFCSNCGKKWYQ